MGFLQSCHVFSSRLHEQPADAKDDHEQPDVQCLDRPRADTFNILERTVDHVRRDG